MTIMNLKIQKDKYEKEARTKLYKTINPDKTEWDPAGKSPMMSEVRDKNIKNHSTYLFLKNNPNYAINTALKIGAIFAILFIIFEIIIAITTKMHAARIYIPLGLIVSLAIFYHYVTKSTKDIIKLEVANQKNYLYWPDINHDLWRTYQKKYPEIFSKGDKYQNLEDIFWGTEEINNKKVHFTTGIFNYTTTTRDKDGNERNTKHTDHYFIIKLPKKLESRFFLYPENIFSKITNMFQNKEINTESYKFNKTFAFSYKGKRSEKEMNITKILTPRVQEELLNLSEHKKKQKSFLRRHTTQGLSILFAEEEVIYYAPGHLLTKTKTNFFTQNTIHNEDKEKITQELQTITKISNEIIKYLE
ncbi:MAG: hypothetical protein ACLFN8_01870 [Candidatus Woesearchaeota archaeon]